MTYPSVIIVGAGAVATTLARALRLAGVPVLGLWGRDQLKVGAASDAARVGGFWGEAGLRTLALADVVIVAVSDRALAPVGQGILGYLRKGQTVAHTSGVAPADALGPQRTGVHVAAFHPLQAVKPSKARNPFAGSYAVLEGPAPALRVLKRLARALAMPTAVLPPGETPRRLYHAAAVHSSNYLVTLVDHAVTMLVAAGLDATESRRMLLPLLRSALTNLETLEPPQALTGPIARGDAATVEKHMAALEPWPEIQQVYAGLGQATVALAKRRGTDPKLLDAVSGTLTPGKVPGSG
jgi:predicted short-subunit dehydrogenase-like oxidoreductase (DUF2520 family)